MKIDSGEIGDFDIWLANRYLGNVWTIHLVGDPRVADPSLRFTIWFDDTTSLVVTSNSVSRDVWFHFALTWDKDTETAQWYVDGIADVSGSSSGKTVVDFLNAFHNKMVPGKHLADDWTMYNTVKSATWIRKAYQIEHEPRTACADIFRDSPATKKRYFLKIGGVEEIFWDSTAAPGRERDARLLEADVPGRLPITRDCLAYWRMDAHKETFNEPDWTGRRHTAVGVSDPPITSYGLFWDPNSRCRGPFNASNDGFVVYNDPQLQPQSPFTVVIWLHVTGGITANAPIIIQDHASKGCSWAIRNGNSTNRIMQWRMNFTDGGSLEISTHAVTRAEYGWYMIAGVWDGAQGHLYMGNSLQGSAAPSGGSGGTTIDYDTSDILIGRDGSEYINYWVGPTAIYNEAKSQEWMHAVYMNGRGYLNRQGLRCLRLPENELSLSLDLKTMKTDASAMTFELDNIRDPYDRSTPRKYFFAKLFAPGRIAGENVYSTTIRRRKADEEQLDADADIVYGQNNDSFPDAGVAVLGQELFSYTAKGSVTQSGFPSNQPIDSFTGCTRGLYPAITDDAWSRTYPYPRQSDLETGDVGNDQVVSTEAYSIVGRDLGLWCVAWNEELGAWYPEQQAELIWAGQVSDSIVYNPKRNTWQLTGENVVRRLEKEVGRHFPSGYVEGINLNGDKGRQWWCHFYNSSGLCEGVGSFALAKGFYHRSNMTALMFTQMNDPTNWILYPGPGTFTPPKWTVKGLAPDGTLTFKLQGTSTHTNGVLWVTPNIDPTGQVESPCHAWQANGFDATKQFSIRFTDDSSKPEGTIEGEHPSMDHYHPTHVDCNGGILRAYWQQGDKLWENQGDWTDAPGSPALTDGAIAVWRCDETTTGANLTDASGAGRTGVAQSAGETAIPQGKFNGARYPAGGAGGWFVAYTSAIQPEEFTLQCWIYIASAGTQGKIFQHRTAAGLGSAVDLRVTTSQIFEFYVQHSDLTYAQCSSTTTASDLLTTWAHIRATWDGKTASLYINGILEDSDSSSPGDVDYGVYPLAIGRDHATSSWPFPGYIDDAAFYGRAIPFGAAWFIFHNAYPGGFESEKREYIGAYQGKSIADDPDKGYYYQLVIAPTGATGGATFDSMHHDLAGFVGGTFREDPIRFQNCYVIQPGTGLLNVNQKGPIESLLYPLLSTGTAGYNGAYDTTPEPLSVGFPVELVDTASFTDRDTAILSSFPTLTTSRFYVIEKPIPWADLWQREAQMFGLIAVWERGQLRCKSIAHPSTHLIDVTIDAPQREGRDHFPEVTLDARSVVNRWTIKTSHNLDGEKAQFKPTFNDVESQFGLDFLERVDIEHPGIQVHAKKEMEQSVDELFDLLLLDRAWLFRYAQQRVTVALAPSEFNRFGAGDTVNYLALKHPDPFGSGEMTIDGKALVLNYAWSIRRHAGTADLLVFSIDVDDFRPWAGAALVDISAANGGWDAANYRFTLTPRHYGKATDSKDGYAFNDGDEVMILESAPEDTLNPQSWGPYAVDGAFETDGTDLLTIETATLAGWDSTVEYTIVPAKAADAVWDQLETNLYQADALTHLIPSAPPHPVDSSCVVCYRCDETNAGDNLIDVGPYGLDSVAQRGTEPATVGKINGGRQSGFGTTARFFTPYNSALYPATFTLCAWVYTYPDALPHVLFEQDSNDPGRRFIVLRDDWATDNFEAEIDSNPFGSLTVTASGTPHDNKWLHLAVTWDGTNLTMFFNGSQVATNSWANGINGAGTSYGAQIGGAGSVPWDVWRFDELCFYNEVKDSTWLTNQVTGLPPHRWG